jgi:hypothetical protein
MRLKNGAKNGAKIQKDSQNFGDFSPVYFVPENEAVCQKLPILCRS